jgi:hypothetical protein
MAKLQHLISSNHGVTGIMITFGKKFDVEYLQKVSYDVYANDILLCQNPTIYTNLNTLRKLGEGSIDFDYTSDEFIITRKE